MGRCAEQGASEVFSRRSALRIAGVLGTSVLGAGALGAGALLAGCSSRLGNGGAVSEEHEGKAGGAGEQTYWLYNPAGIKENGLSVDEELKQTMQREGIDKPALAGQSSSNVEMLYTNSLYAETAELYYHRGWTDGLPIVPPTEQNVSAMMRGTDLPRNHVVATLEPLGGKATVEKIAVNAVMAGCKPEYLPVVIAAVEAIADPAFDLAGSSTTTGPCAPLLVVNGPVAKQIDMNSGANALGRGWAANVSIGRALQLIQQNIGGSWPRVSDYSSLGMPGDIGTAVAENEEQNPWAPLHVELGYGEKQNVVTVASIESANLVVDIGVSAEGFLLRLANCIAGGYHVQCDYLLMLTPATAKNLRTNGWDKASIRTFLNEHMLIHESRIKNAPLIDMNSKQSVEQVVYGEPDENGMIEVPFVRHLTIVVAGGVGEKNEYFPLWSVPVSRSILLPEKWDELLAGT